MPHKIEIDSTSKTIKLDGVDISETVADWSFSFSENNLNISGGRSPFAMIFRRFVFDGDKPMSDDSGRMVYTQIFNDVEVLIRVDGKVSNIVKPPPGMKLIKK